MILYFIQVISFQLAFYLMYNFFFQKETFYSYNRAYLLFTPLLSIALPFIEIEALKRHIPAEIYLSLSAAKENMDVPIQQFQSITLTDYLVGIWIIGSVVFLVRFLIKLYGIYSIASKNGKTRS